MIIIDTDFDNMFIEQVKELEALKIRYEKIITNKDWRDAKEAAIVKARAIAISDALFCLRRAVKYEERII